tara:strand:- start:494 stop:757 length:264 start_codon:yes stop_codon:yes gene_type:complete
MAIETFSLYDNYENNFVVKNISYEEAAALRDSKEPVANHNYSEPYQYAIYSDTYKCDNCYHEEDFNHCTCEIQYDYIRICGYCNHQI